MAVLVTITHERTRKGIGKEISRTVTPIDCKVDHRPLCALIYDYMVKEGYIGGQKEVK